MDTIIINNKDKEKPQPKTEEPKAEEVKAEQPQVKPQPSQKRAGHNNTATILTSAGVSMVSGAGGAAGTMAYMNSQNQHADFEDDEDEEDENEGEGNENEGEENENNENDNNENNENDNNDNEDNEGGYGNEDNEEDNGNTGLNENGDNDFNNPDDDLDNPNVLVDNDILPVDDGGNTPPSADGFENIDNADLVDTSNFGNIDNVEPGENVQLVDNVEPVENVQPTDNIEPIDNGLLADNNGQDTPPVDIDDVLPDDIAQELVSEIDENDIDGSGIFDVTAVETQYNTSGQEMQVAMIQTPDGGQFMMVDVDNDMTFDVITDLEGNPVGQVEAALTFSDIEDMLDETGGYLAPTENDGMELAQEVNIANDDVVNTDGTGTDIAALLTDEYDDTNVYPDDDPLLADNTTTDVDSDFDPSNDMYEV